MNKKLILIIEDDTELIEGIKLVLSNERYSFLEAENGEDGLSKMSDDIDLVILDIMMPGTGGIEVCQQIRKSYSVPILFLTAKATETDKIIGLNAGADDYLTKPFSYIELNGRVSALLRRYCLYKGREESGCISGDNYIEIDGIKIHKNRNEVIINDKEINLTETEYQLLLLLMKKPNRSQNAKYIYETIWNEPYFYGANSTIMVHIKNLRTKIEPDPKAPSHIITVWGKGYQFQKLVVL